MTTEVIILFSVLAVALVMACIFLFGDLGKHLPVFRDFKNNEPRLYDVSLKEWVEVKLVTGDIFYVRKSEFNQYDTYFYPFNNEETQVFKSSIASCKDYSRGTGCLEVGNEVFSVVVVGDNKKNPHTFIFDHESEDRIKKGSKIEINSIQGYVTNGKVTEVDIHYGLLKFYTINYNKEEK